MLMEGREDSKKSKRLSRSGKSKLRIVDDEVETEYSYGSMDNSTESSLHGDEMMGESASADLSGNVPGFKSKEREKRCVFCWRGEKSSLGQGTLVRCDPSPNFNPFRRPLKGRQNSSEVDAAKRRNRGDSSKSPKRRIETGKFSNVYNELSDVGLPHDVTPYDIFEETDRSVYAHHCCAAWNECVLQAEDFSLQGVDKAAFNGLTTKCSFCDKYGATIQCKALRCNRKFHYPCASGSGCFQDIKTLTMLCPDHSHLAESTAKDESHCVVCGEPGDILRQLFCTSCGQHYHGDCLDPEIECNTVVRAGWQCPECKVCQGCRNPGDDNKMLVCDFCDKGYHTFCLNPAMKGIPNNSWRCSNCRSCVDCGMKDPQNGPALRWHSSYTQCDNCYTSKGKAATVCPVCKKSYKLNNLRGLTQCHTSKKYVHNSCDAQTEQTDHKKYRCASCAQQAADSPVTECHAESQMDMDTSLEEDLELNEYALQRDFESDSEFADSEKMSTCSSSSRVRPAKAGKGKPASFARGKPGAKKPGKNIRNTTTGSSRSKGKIIKKRSRLAASDRKSSKSKAKASIASQQVEEFLDAEKQLRNKKFPAIIGRSVQSLPTIDQSPLR